MKIKCAYCSTSSHSPDGSRICGRAGKFWRKSDGRWIQRFFCKSCKKGFSQATSKACFNQNKRHKNQMVRKLLAGGMSQREVARVLLINRKTVVRKLLYWAQRGDEELLQNPKVQACDVQFDDLETFEHTKCKPLSVTLMVETKTRRILGFEVSQMPCKGRLAPISRKKYGLRRDQRARGRNELFQRVKPQIHPGARICSDSNPHYAKDIKKHFPHCTYETVKGARGRSTAQGELKKIKWDPLFSLNHTCAMLRANINRLFRKTWCTTKRPDRLRAHLSLYVYSHNLRLSEKC